MTSKTLTISLVLALLVGVGLGFMGGRAVFKPVGEPETQIDTIYYRDTITREKPVYLTRWVRDTMLVPVTDTIRLRDTLWLDLPREVREYGDSTYRAVVSGFRPSLDRIDIYQRERTITKYVSVPSPRLGFGVQAGVGVVGAFSNPAPQVGYYIGVGATWKFGK